MHAGADLETPTKEVAIVDPLTNQTTTSIVVDVDVLNNYTSKRAVFTEITMSEKIDRFFQCAHRPASNTLQHDFYEDFESRRLSTRWAVQRPVSEDASTQITPAYGFGGATTGESGVAKEIFWLDGDRGYSLRVRRPFQGAVQINTVVRKEARCSNHWMAISRSKTFTSGVEKKKTLFRDPLLRPDYAAWIYPRAMGDKYYGRANNPNQNNARLHYGFGSGSDRPFKEDELQVESNPTDLKAAKAAEEQNTKAAAAGLWFAGPAGGATFVRMSNAVDRGSDANGGLMIKIKINKNQKCSNHFIVLSEDPKYEFGWGPSAAQNSGSIALGFNCETKVIYTSTGNTMEVPCPNVGTTELRIKITSQGIVFEDDFKCPVLKLTGESTLSPSFYIYLGASQDTQDHTATTLRVARRHHVSNSTNNATLDAEDTNDGAVDGAGRYLRSYFRDFSVVQILVPGIFDPETIVVGWGCNTKIAIGIGGGAPIKKTHYCPYQGRHRISLDMTSKTNTVVFRTTMDKEIKNTPEECDSGLGSLPSSLDDDEDEATEKSGRDRTTTMCPDIEIPSNFTKRGIYYVFIGAGAYPTSDQPVTRKTVYETLAIDVKTRQIKIDDDASEDQPVVPAANSELFFGDSFGAEEESKSWKTEHDHGHNHVEMDATTGEKVLIFNDTTLVPVRTRRPFRAPFLMVSDILKDQKCNNHFFLLSTRKLADFNFGTPTTGDVSKSC